MDKGAPRDPVQVEEHLWEDAAGEFGWDVGANMGQSVDKMVELFHRVLAFEPAQESFDPLAAEYGSNPKVRLLPVAVSDHAGMLDLAVRSAPIMTGQLTAVGMPYHGEHAGEPGVANWGADVAVRSVECVTLDQVAEQMGYPDFVKVDTEGHEAQVLRGAYTIIHMSGGPRWLIEHHTADLHDECVMLLEDGGYDVETVRHPHYPDGSYMWFAHGWLRASRKKDSDAEPG